MTLCGQCKHYTPYRNEFFQCAKFVPVPGRVRRIVQENDEPVDCPGAEPKESNMKIVKIHGPESLHTFCRGTPMSGCGAELDVGREDLYRRQVDGEEGCTINVCFVCLRCGEETVLPNRLRETLPGKGSFLPLVRGQTKFDPSKVGVFGQ